MPDPTDDRPASPISADPLNELRAAFPGYQIRRLGDAYYATLNGAHGLDDDRDATVVGDSPAELGSKLRAQRRVADAPAAPGFILESWDGES